MNSYLARNVPQPCREDNGDYLWGMMKRVAMLTILAAILATTFGCKSSSGSREFVPGRGWVPND